MNNRLTRFCQHHSPASSYLDSLARWAAQEVAYRLWVRNCIVVSIWG
jgi:hypothetical protein